MTCPSELERTRAITTGEPEIAAHVAGCDSCRAAWDEIQAAIELARELPVLVAPAAHREEMRTALLARAAAPRRRVRPAWLVPAAALAATAGLTGYLARPRGDARAPGSAPSPVAVAGHRHGTVRPQPGARYLIGTPSPDEVVVLVDGALDVEVATLHAGERYRVVVGSAEVEVRGTAFTITAREARLVAVRVAHGRVDIRPERGAAITLTAGESWQPDVAAALVVVAPVVAATPSRARSRPARRPPQVVEAPPHEAPLHEAPLHEAPVYEAPVYEAPPRAAEEVAYDAAWRALRANDFAHAASGFARVLLLAPDSALVEDASFWHGVALARAGRSAEAVSAFRDFLEGYARSARAGEASTMLGWILIDRREDDEAARRFRAGIADRNPAVRASAQAGLDALARRPPVKS